MNSPAVWILLTAAGTTGAAVSLTASLGKGVRGHGLRRIDVRGGSTDIREFAAVGARLAYDILSREKYLDWHVVARYEAGAGLVNVHGRSADLAFALAFAAGVAATSQGFDAAVPAVAGTGMLGDDGAIQGIDGLPEKLALAFTVLPPGGMFIFPPSTSATSPASCGVRPPNGT